MYWTTLCSAIQIGMDEERECWLVEQKTPSGGWILFHKCETHAEASAVSAVAYQCVATGITRVVPSRTNEDLSDSLLSVRIPLKVIKAYGLTGAKFVLMKE